MCDLEVLKKDILKVIDEHKQPRVKESMFDKETLESFAKGIKDPAAFAIHMSQFQSNKKSSFFWSTLSLLKEIICKLPFVHQETFQIMCFIMN